MLKTQHRPSYPQDPVHLPLHPAGDAQRAGEGRGPAAPVGDGVPLPDGDGGGGLLAAAHRIHQGPQDGHQGHAEAGLCHQVERKWL